MITITMEQVEQDSVVHIFEGLDKFMICLGTIVISL